jgi:hypothetical protein
VHNGYAAMNGRSATMATLAESKHRKIGPFNARARTPVPQYCDSDSTIAWSPFKNRHIALYPAAIIGTAMSAAIMPTVRQRVKCSPKKMRARMTVSAG